MVQVAIILYLQTQAMYNSFIFRKHSQQHQSQQSQAKQKKKWLQKYHNTIRPALIEKYSRRINNFVVRLQEDKKELYEYRQETEAKAHELLKEIYRKERFLGDAHIRLRDTKDWNSILTTTDRMEKEKNKTIFQSKYGDASVAYRSIASQSTYNPAASNEFRHRVKTKEIHPHNMRFSSRSESFNNNRKEKVGHARAQTSAKSEEREYLPRRLSSNHNNPSEEQGRSRAHSVFSFGNENYREQVQQSISNNKEPLGTNTKEPNNSKVYFKQIVDLQQHTKDPSIRKSLHQILVRFGVSRIKDIKKQAMVQTDNLQSDDF